MPRAGDTTGESIRTAAIELFAEQGYESTTLRCLASAVGIQVGSVYNHIASKEALLYSIMSDVVRDLVAEMEATLARRSDPLARLGGAVELHIRFHARRAAEVFIGNSELRSLSPTHRAAVVEQRDAYERIFRQLLDDGVRAGDFRVPDTRVVSYAILALGSNVAAWHTVGGRLSIDEIVSIYADFVLRAVASPRGTSSMVAHGFAA